MRTPTISVCTTALWLVVLPVELRAHHSFAATFEAETIAELEGEVVNIAWRNPHVLFTLRTTDANGQETVFDIESHSLSIMRRMEISSDALNVGDRIRVAGHPARRRDNAMFVLNALLPDGQEIVFDPFGGARWATNVGTTSVWQATEGEAQDDDNGIFRVWITSVTHPNAWPFPEMFNLSLIDNYPLTEQARAAVDAFNPLTDLPTRNCVAKGMPAIMEQPYPMEIVDAGDTIVLRLEEYDTVRTIHMNETVAPAGTPASDLGYSTGHWEGNTLVVNTTNISWRFFNSVGVPLSGAAEIEERLTPSDDRSELELMMTVTDSATFTEPVEVGKTWLAISGVQVEPYECTN